MLETVAVPILVKAVEWLFGEGSKILEERRERRKAQQGAVEADSQKEQSEATQDSSSSPAKPATAIQNKEEVLGQPVAEIAWRDSEPHIKHLLSLLDIHAKNYRLAKEQYAKWGSALVPSIIVSNLTEAEDEIAKTTKELQAALNQVYDKKVAIPEVEQA